MRVLVIAAHGSRLESSNAEVRRMAGAVAATSQGRFEAVALGFLELTTPLLAEVLDEQVRAGARELVIVPYLLAAGRHVTSDIPAIVQATRERHPEISIRVTAHAGLAPGMANLLLDLADPS